MTKRVALYGGSFNPIHNGHVIIARSVAEQLGLDRVIFLVSARPPHKHESDLLGAEDRLEMVTRALMSERGFEISGYELSLPGPNYTIQTVSHFLDVLGSDSELYWIIGADSLNELTTWYRVEELVQMCHIVTAHRPGSDEIDWPTLREKLGDERCSKLESGIVSTPRIEISSTDIRQRVREGRSISCLVPDAVRDFIKEHNLYA